MELAQFLHIETRKCSWFAHWWMAQHCECPEDFPLNLEGSHWAEEYRLWEQDGCPNPNSPGVLHRYD